MNVAIFIQARLTSTRLPGKVLMKLGDKAVIDRIFTEANSIAYTSILIPENKENDALAEHLSAKTFFRGSETDVLSRFYAAYQNMGSKPIHIVRLTADCPLISRDMIRLVIAAHLAGGKEYTSNRYPLKKAPKGWDVEVFTAEALTKAHMNATDNYDREHVTPWIRKNCLVNKLKHFCLDTSGDYSYLESIVKNMDLIL